MAAVLAVPPCITASTSFAARHQKGSCAIQGLSESGVSHCIESDSCPNRSGSRYLICEAGAVNSGLCAGNLYRVWHRKGWRCLGGGG